MTLEFTAEPHEYRFDGKLVPSVTQILGGLVDYSKINPQQLREARDRGVHVHKLVEYWAQETLDVAALPEWMVPVYERWIDFVRSSGFRLIASEKQVYHRSLRYAGTLDLRCTIARYGDQHGIIDIKRSFLAGPVIGLQLAGYKLAENQDPSGPRVHWRAALRLSEKGPARLEFFDDPSDEATFMAFLISRRFTEKHGLAL